MPRPKLKYDPGFALLVLLAQRYREARNVHRAIGKDPNYLEMIRIHAHARMIEAENAYKAARALFNTGLYYRMQKEEGLMVPVQLRSVLAKVKAMAIEAETERLKGEQGMEKRREGSALVNFRRSARLAAKVIRARVLIQEAQDSFQNGGFMRINDIKGEIEELLLPDPEDSDGSCRT